MKITKSDPFIHFEKVSKDQVTEDEAERLQQQVGYLVMGYGFYKFKCVKGEGGLYHATWTCSSSCD